MTSNYLVSSRLKIVSSGAENDIMKIILIVFNFSVILSPVQMYVKQNQFELF